MPRTPDHPIHRDEEFERPIDPRTGDESDSTQGVAYHSDEERGQAMDQEAERWVHRVREERRGHPDEKHEI